MLHDVVERDEAFFGGARAMSGDDAHTSPECEIAGNGMGKFVSRQASVSRGPNQTPPSLEVGYSGCYGGLQKRWSPVQYAAAGPV